MRKLLAALTLIVGAGLLYAVFQFFDINEFLVILSQIPPVLVLAYLIVSFAIMLALILRWKIICNQHKVRIGFLQLLAYRYVGFAVSFITPGPRVGGEPVRAGMMGRQGISFSKSMSTVVADKTNELLSFGVMFVIALFAATIRLPLPNHLRIGFQITGVVLLGLVIFGMYNIIQGKDPVLKIYRLLRLDKVKWLKKYKKQLQEFENNIQHFYGENPKHFWQAFIISCCAWSLSLLEFALVLLMLGIQPTVLSVFLIYTVVGLTYLLPIPFALGSLEAGQATLFVGLGLSTIAGAALAMITRMRDLLWTFIGLCLLAVYTVEKKRTHELQTTSKKHNQT